MAELKPCPFCGGESELKYADRYYWVECTVCHARSNDECVDDFERGHQKTIDLLVKTWNRRTGDEIRTCPLTTYPTKCTDKCEECTCGGEKIKDW